MASEESDESIIDDMLDTLEEAKNTTRTVACKGCDTKLTSETVMKKDRGDRVLHHCRECGRTLTTREYRKWKSINTR